MGLATTELQPHQVLDNFLDIQIFICQGRPEYAIEILAKLQKQIQLDQVSLLPEIGIIASIVHTLFSLVQVFPSVTNTTGWWKSQTMDLGTQMMSLRLLTPMLKPQIRSLSLSLVTTVSLLILVRKVTQVSNLADSDCYQEPESNSSDDGELDFICEPGHQD